MDQNQEKILTEIKILEEKFKEGNKRKVTYSLVAGGVTGVVGGAVILAAPMLAPGMMMGMTVMPSFTTLALANVGLTLTGAGGGYFLTNGKKETQLNLNNGFKKRIEGHLKLLAGAKNGNKIDFIFNLESSVYPEYQKIAITEISKKAPFVNKDTVLPLNMAGYYVKIGNIFTDFFKKEPKDRPFVEKITITNAEMTDNQFMYLINEGIGCCATKVLDLSKNRLTVLSIEKLRNHILKNKSSFLDLNSLNLSYNNLSALALPAIQAIVDHLNIQTLDLSGNEFYDKNGTKKDLKTFLENLPKTMPSIKVLKITDIGLTNDFSKSLKKMLIEGSILTHLDITHNPQFEHRKLKSLLYKGFLANQSVRELLVDHRENLGMEPLILSKDDLYAKMTSLPNQTCPSEAPRFLILLNRYCKNISADLNIDDALSSALKNQLKAIADDILDLRMKIFKITGGYSIPITEKEFVMYRSNKLDNFYSHAISSNVREGLDAKLFINIGAHDPKQKIHQTSYDLDIEEQEIAKKTTFSDKTKPSVLKPF